MRYSIHGNLNKKCGSLKNRTKGIKEPVEHVFDSVLYFENVEFKVQAGGHRKIAFNGAHREIVAYAVGDLISRGSASFDLFANSSEYVQVSYNPVDNPTRDYFYVRATGEKVTHASEMVVVCSSSCNNRTNTKVYIKI
tara:strand:- start:270 stop:683 length:414 start_codon:yes stop_codon:yes gene_type:complete